jgi:hypothetical protein
VAATQACRVDRLGFRVSMKDVPGKCYVLEISVVRIETGGRV